MYEKIIESEIFCFFMLKTHISFFWVDNFTQAVNGTNRGGGGGAIR